MKVVQRPDPNIYKRIAEKKAHKGLKRIEDRIALEKCGGTQSILIRLLMGIQHSLAAHLYRTEPEELSPDAVSGFSELMRTIVATEDSTMLLDMLWILAMEVLAKDDIQLLLQESAPSHLISEALDAKNKEQPLSVTLKGHLN